mmetsp:Transcript_15857/g.51197  ORF Transcript_15857/g.51197 Transcript_15857/m.51197 type:complete len:200 (-) Transcript_15857:936-1535(-)
MAPAAWPGRAALRCCSLRGWWARAVTAVLTATAARRLPDAQAGGLRTARRGGWAVARLQSRPGGWQLPSRRRTAGTGKTTALTRSRSGPPRGSGLPRRSRAHGTGRTAGGSLRRQVWWARTPPAGGWLWARPCRGRIGCIPPRCRCAPPSRPTTPRRSPGGRAGASRSVTPPRLGMVATTRCRVSPRRAGPPSSRPRSA